MQYIKLRDGNKIPCMGYGCYNAFGDEMVNGISRAVEVGYRYIDSAEKYGNEEAVGRGLKRIDVPREEMFILSKAWPSSYDNLEAAAMKTMKDLQVEYLDAYLLHWPGTDETRRLKAYEQLLKLKEKGICRTAAVSNFIPEMLQVIAKEFGEYPAINENEMHPTYQQRELGRFCREHGVQTIAYSPINRAKDLKSEAVLSLAEKYDKTPGQIVLRWHVQKNQIPIPKSANYDRILQNISIFDFDLTEEELQSIDAMECGEHTGLDYRVVNG